MGLPRVHRLKRRQDFNAVYQSGLRRQSSHLTLRALQRATESSGSTPSRVGITISQKVSKRAVVRNRIKRQIRAALRQMLPSFPTGWQIVVVVKPSAIECDYAQFLQELKQLLLNAEVLNEH